MSVRLPTEGERGFMFDLLQKPIKVMGHHCPASINPDVVEAIRLGWIAVERTYSLTDAGRRALNS